MLDCFINVNIMLGNPHILYIYTLYILYTHSKENVLNAHIARRSSVNGAPQTWNYTVAPVLCLGFMALSIIPT